MAWDPAGILCFVEVKTRSPDAIAQGREAVKPEAPGAEKDA